MLSRLARLLLVRPVEITRLAYFFGLFLLLGVGMALGQGSAEALFFKRYGIQHLPAMYIALSAVLCSTSILYAAYADRIPAERLFELVFPVLVTAIGIAWALMTFTTASAAYPIYYLIYQVASEIVVVHAVLYISQNFELLQIKRLSSLIMAGTQVGVIMGGLALPFIVQAIGVQDVLLVWALSLCTSLILMRVWHGQSGVSKLFRPHRDHGKGHLRQSVTHVTQGFRFMRESPLLRADSMALFFMVIAYYILGYSVNRIYAHTFESDAALASFFGTLTAVTSAIALVLQTLLSNRVIARFGVKNVNLLFPITSLLSYGSLLFSFSFVPALIGSVNADALMPAFREPARHIIREALPGNMKGRAGALSLVAVLPAALLLCGAMLLVAQLFNNPIYYLIAGSGATALYLRYSLRMNRAYASELVRHLKKTLSIPGGLLDNGLRRSDSKVLRELRSGVLHEDPQVAVAFAKAFLAADPALAGEVVLERAAGAGDTLHDQLLRLLIPYDIKGLEEYLLKHCCVGDDHLRATVLSMLIRVRSDAAIPLVEKALESASPRLVSAGILGALCYPIERCRAAALARWHGLLDSSVLNENLAALEVGGELWSSGVGQLNDVEESVKNCVLRNLDGECRGQIAALQMIERWPHKWPCGLYTSLEKVYESPDWRVREGCVVALGRVARSGDEILLERACGDPDARVRKAAVGALNDGSDVARGRLMAWLVSENRGSPRTQQTVLASLQQTGLDTASMVQIAASKAQQAKEIASYLTTLDGSPLKSTGLKLLRQVLEERLQQVLDLALMAIQPLESPETVAAIRMAFKSRDPKHVAHACEGYRNAGNRQLAGVLADLMEYFVVEERHGRGRGRAAYSIGAVLEWAMDSADPWLSRCGSYANETLSETGAVHAGSV